MSRPTITQPADLWLVDGTLRDVYVYGAGPKDWDTLLAVAQDHEHQYFVDGTATPVPEADAIFQDREHSHLLCIEVERVKIHSHFFSPGEIELDIDPKEVAGPSQHNAVLQFLEHLATATRKDLLITAENSPELVFLRYETQASHWHIHEPSTAREA